MNLKDRPYLEVKLATNGKVGHRENINKVKVPFYCYFSKNGLTKRVGLVSRNGRNYYLIDMSYQSRDREDVAINDSLDELLIRNNVEIRKAKVIIYG